MIFAMHTSLSPLRRARLSRRVRPLARVALAIAVGMLAAVRPPSTRQASPIRIAQAADDVHNVTSVLDEPDATPGDANCVSTPSGVCTLRAAIQEANFDPQHDLVLLPNTSDSLTYVISSSLVITTELTLRTASGTNVGPRIIQSSGFSPGPVVEVNATGVTLQGLTIQGGAAGGLTVQPGAVVALVNSAVLSNTGTGINNRGTLAITNATVSDNDGGGIVNNTGGTLTLDSSTITANTGSATSSGGLTNNGLVVTVTNSILAGNILVDPMSPDCDGTINSGGNNLIGSTAGCTIVGGAGDRLNEANPQLGPLQFNGGAGFTHALLPGSPAVDAGGSCPAKDQRGADRPQGATCDIGAYELPVLNIATAGLTLSESAGQANFTARLDAKTAYTVTAVYSTTNLTARAGQDYTAVNATLVIPPFSTTNTLTLTVPVLADDVYEITETLRLGLLNPAGAGLGMTQTATITLTSPDPAPQVRFTAGAYAAAETAGQALVTAMLDRASELPALVNYATADGTARAGQDYTALGGVLTFTSFVTTTVLPIAIANDGVYENAETLTIGLTAHPAGDPATQVSAGPAAPLAATVTITNSDPMPRVYFRPEGQTSFNENVGAAAVDVLLTQLSELTTTVTYFTRDGTARAGQDYTAVTSTLTFAPRQGSRTVAFGLLADGRYELGETFLIGLTDPGNAQLGNPEQDQPITRTLTLQNVDPQPEVHFGAAEQVVGEAAGVYPLPVQLSAPSEVTASVAYSLTPGSAVFGVDYSLLAAGTLTFAPGVTTTTIPITVTDDPDYEPVESLTLTLAGPAAAALSVPDATTVWIADNDQSYTYLATIYQAYNPYDEVEPNGGAGEATGPVASGGTYFGRYNGAGATDFDFYYFDLASTGAVQVTVNGLASAQVGGGQVQLYYGPPGGGVRVGFDGHTDGNPFFSVAHAPAAPGRYFIIIVMPSGYTGGTYTLRATYP